LRTLTALELPDALFAAIPPKVLATYRLCAATEPPSDLRRRPAPTRYTLMAAVCWHRRKAIIDGLVDLLLRVVHRITVRTEKKVVKELLQDIHSYTIRRSTIPSTSRPLSRASSTRWNTGWRA
jgi:hypothetical protein